MDDSQDKIYMWINRDDTELQGREALLPVLQRLDASFLARPKTLEVTGSSDRPIQSFLDSAVLKALDSRKRSIALLSDGSRVGVSQLRNRTALSISFPPGPAIPEIRQLFFDLLRLIRPTYARTHFFRHAEELYEKHYKENNRSFYANGLYWLNFFGPEEEARQGARLAQNPHARVERLPEGLVMEVGTSPEEALTPEGERKLLAATAALPSVPTAGELPPTPQQSPNQSAAITTVDGVRGFLDDVDQSFWITKHLGPDETLDPKTVEKFKRLAGKGSPEIKGVHVLFSDPSTAMKNRQNLASAGIRVWYVDPNTGQPHEA